MATDLVRLSLGRWAEWCVCVCVCDWEHVFSQGAGAASPKWCGCEIGPESSAVSHYTPLNSFATSVLPAHACAARHSAHVPLLVPAVSLHLMHVPKWLVRHVGKEVHMSNCTWIFNSWAFFNAETRLLYEDVCGEVMYNICIFVLWYQNKAWCDWQGIPKVRP